MNQGHLHSIPAGDNCLGSRCCEVTHAAASSWIDRAGEAQTSDQVAPGMELARTKEFDIHNIGSFLQKYHVKTRYADDT